MKVINFLFKFRLLILILAALLVGFFLYYKNSQIKTNAQASITTQESDTKSFEINKEMLIPIFTDSNKKTDQKLSITLTTAEKTEKMTINGKPATAKVGKTFLILNIKVSNPTNDRLKLRIVDFFRLTGENGENFAADVFSDPFRAEPSSVKMARIAFVVDKNKNDFKILMGEIDGQKQTIDFTL